MGKIISLKFDFSFKHLFLNEEVRCHFISDVLGIPLEEIRKVRLANTFLWKRFKKQKQGILDVSLELNNDSKVDIELQIEMLDFWDRRSLFYLAKLFTEGLFTGQEYDKLKRCISISVIGFNLDKRPEYHKVYRLRDETGHEFSDLLEIHIIELNKSLNGVGRMDDWIRLFNARTEEELKMLEMSTKSAGILAAIKEVREMSLLKSMKELHEAKQKEIRDRNARESYVRKEGVKQGIEQGIEQGGGLKLIDQVQRKLRKGKIPEIIAEELEEPLENAERICDVVIQCGLDADPQEIYDKMQNKVPVQ